MMKYLILFAICCVLSLPASAQDREEIVREGFMFGLATGVAHSKLDFPNESQGDAGFALNWKIGYMVNPRLAVLLNGAASVYEYDLSDRDRLRDFGGVFASAQYFVSDDLWLLAGAGVGTDAPVFFDLETDSPGETDYHAGLGVVSGVGFEFYRAKRVAFDVQARLTYGTVALPIGQTDGFTSAVLVGVNLY